MTDITYPTLEDINAAHGRIRHMIHNTPILTCSAIDEKAGCQIFFKCENFQKVGAFKARGAANAVLKLSEADKKKGVATHSSGNHAAALARAATKAGIPAYIVMPSTAPDIKKKAVLTYGGKITLCEPTLASRESTLAAVVRDTGATFVPPFDDLDVIEGQATCALEMWQMNIAFDAIIAPVGGGGLLGGTALTTHYISPSTIVIGAEPEGADDAFRSFQAKKRLPLVSPNSIADGLLTSLGELNFAIMKDFVADILTVSDLEIIEAMRLIYERMKIIVEPSCAVPLAALLKNKGRFQGKKVGIILSGGNVDLSKLPF
jgi:threonine dehydratase